MVWINMGATYIPKFDIKSDKNDYMDMDTRTNGYVGH